MPSDLKIDSTPDLSDEAGTVDTEPPVSEKSLLRKIDAKLLPAVGILYLLSFLDRSNGEIWTGFRSDKHVLTYCEQLETPASREWSTT